LNIKPYIWSKAISSKAIVYSWILLGKAIHHYFNIWLHIILNLIGIKSRYSSSYIKSVNSLNHP